MNDELRVNEVFKLLYFNFRYLFIITFASSTLAIVYSLIVTPIYQSVSIIAPRSSILNTLESAGDGLVGVSGLAASISGGLGLTSADGRTSFLVEKMQGYQTFSSAIFPEYGRYLENGVVWDEELKQTVMPENSANRSAQDLYRDYKRALNISVDQKTGFVTVSFRHVSPEIAFRVVQVLIDDANRQMTQLERAYYESSLEFLTSSQSSYPSVEVSQAISQLIVERTQRLALLSEENSSPFIYVERGVQPERRIYPSRARMVLGYTALGATLAVFYVIVFGRRPKAEQNDIANASI